MEPNSNYSVFNPLLSGKKPEAETEESQLEVTINPLWFSSSRKPLEKNQKALNLRLFEVVHGPDPLEEKEFNEAEAVKEVYELLDQGADANSGEYEPILTTAVKGGKTLIASLLVAHEANVNAVDSNGNTALMTAARYNFVEIAKILLLRGADVSIKNKDGRTALEMAAGCDKIKSLITEKPEAKPEFPEANRLEKELENKKTL